MRNRTAFPNPAPKQTKLPPCRHAVAGVVVTDHIFFTVIILTHHRQLFHVVATLLQFLDKSFGILMIAKKSNG